MDQRRRVNPVAVGSLVFSLLPILLFAILLVIGALQNVGYTEIDTYPYERWMKPMMLVSSVVAIVLSYRAQSQILMSNGFYSGASISSAGRNIGFIVGALVLLSVLLWGL